MSSVLRLRFVARDGKPVGEEYCRSMLSLRTMDHRTLRTRVAGDSDGAVAVHAPAAPVQVWLLADVKGFGFVYHAADNGGAGYSPGGGVIDLNREFAQTRLRRVAEAHESSRRTGGVFSAGVGGRIEAARSLLERAASAGDRGEARSFREESLCESLWAGEALALERARQRIERRGRRDDFHWGAKSFLHRRLGSRHDELFTALFNMANVRFYWTSIEPEEGQQRLDRADETVDWIERSGMTAKGHTLIYFTRNCGMPGWVDGRSPGAIKDLLRPRLTEIARRYAGRIRYYDIVNEAHDWGNCYGYDHETILDFVRLGSEAVREGDPEAVRIVNCVYPFADYVARGENSGGECELDMWGPYEFLEAVAAAGIEFEGIGLQMYWAGYDFFETDWVLERFSGLGKPVYVTEAGVSSSDQPDPKAHVKKPHGLWHAPWSEKIQADWAEQLYTICYSKPFLHETSWWDFVDIGTSIPHGGLVGRDADLTPKEAYRRLLALRRGWDAMV